MNRALLLGLLSVITATAGVTMAQDNSSPGPIVRKDLLTAAIAGRKDVYRLGADDRQLIEMLR
jgi:hypothetical protein